MQKTHLIEQTVLSSVKSKLDSLIGEGQHSDIILQSKVGDLKRAAFGIVIPVYDYLIITSPKETEGSQADKQSRKFSGSL